MWWTEEKAKGKSQNGLASGPYFFSLYTRALQQMADDG